MLNVLVTPKKINQILTFKLFGKPKADINYLGWIMKQPLGNYSR